MSFLRKQESRLLCASSCKPDGQAGTLGFFLDSRFRGKDTPQRRSRNCPIWVWQLTEDGHSVAKTLPKQGVSDILWLQAGSARIGENGLSGQPLRRPECLRCTWKMRELPLSIAAAGERISILFGGYMPPCWQEQEENLQTAQALRRHSDPKLPAGVLPS